MNGVHPPDYNRFRELSSTAGRNKPNRPKRPRPEDFTALPETEHNQQNLPRFLVASTIPQNEGLQTIPLAAYNVFQVEKGLNYISRDRLEVKEMKSGDLLIKVPDSKTADKFLKAKYIDNIPVKIIQHRTLNTTQGRIFSRKIVDITQEELLECLKDQKVVDVRMITKREGEKIVATGAAIITFDLIYRPEKLNIGWERVNVEEYIPNPMRCLTCQRLGHTRKWCKSVEQCKECGYAGEHEFCNRKYCVNCQAENHTSYDSECPTFWKHKSVNYLRISRRCTTREAWSIFNENPTLNTLKPVQRNNKKTTYAQVANNQTATNNISITLDTDMESKKNVSNDQNKAAANSTSNLKQQIQNIPPTSDNSSPNFSKNKINSSNSIPHTSTHKENKISTSTLPITLTPIQNSYLQITSLSKESTNQNAAVSIEDDFSFSDANSDTPNYSFDDCFKSNIDENLTEDMVIQEITEGLGLNTPTKTTLNTSNNADTPCTQLYNNFPELNVIITPKTLKKTQSTRGKKSK